MHCAKDLHKRYCSLQGVLSHILSKMVSGRLLSHKSVKFGTSLHQIVLHISAHDDLYPTWHWNSVGWNEVPSCLFFVAFVLQGDLCRIRLHDGMIGKIDVLSGVSVQQFKCNLYQCGFETCSLTAHPHQ